MFSLKTDQIKMEDSVVATWWDYGYASMLFNNLPTFTDPGSHGVNANYFIANVLLSENQQYVADTLRFLARGGLNNLDIPVDDSAELKSKIFQTEKNQHPQFI